MFARMHACVCVCVRVCAPMHVLMRMCTCTSMLQPCIRVPPIGAGVHARVLTSMCRCMHKHTAEMHLQIRLLLTVRGRGHVAGGVEDI